jgi:hypothetical protein
VELAVLTGERGILSVSRGARRGKKDPRGVAF